MDNNVLERFDQQAFQINLINWFEKEKRSMPWRLNQDPYRVWVSEIMLQQTRVDTVIPYYERFMTLFPTVQALAEAKEQDVLKAWEGLGYYSRARNLQTAAIQVMETFDGVIPANTKLLGNLKGIGPYTKGAIMSIAFDVPEPAVDGNVMRVLSRILNISDDIALPKTRKVFEHVVNEIISQDNPSAFNQGLMELGALVCTPKSPMCLLCPVQEHCRAFNEGIVEQLPVKSKAKKKKIEHHAVFIIQNTKGEYLIQYRHEKGLLHALWQFPMVESTSTDYKALEEELEEIYPLDVVVKIEEGTLKHIFTHIVWNLTVYRAISADSELENTSLKFVDKAELETYPFPVSHQKILKAYIK